MLIPTASAASSPATDVAADALIVLVRRTETGVVTLGLEGDVAEGVIARLTAIGMRGGVDESARVPSPDGIAAPSIIAVGIAAPEDPEAVRRAAGVAARAARGCTRIAVLSPAVDMVQPAAEGALLGAYRFTDYRSRRDDDTAIDLSEVVMAGGSDGADEDVARAHVHATAVWTVRDLVNTPPNDLYPASFAERTRELADGVEVTVEELDEVTLRAEGFGGIVGVGQGSSRPPRLVVVRYTPRDDAPHLAIVGKGITFDTGGLSLKPPSAMVGMKYDMTGAATALAATLAIARRGLDVRVTAWLCLAENMPSSTATRPNDVLTMRGGTTVEVLNTDAEGRLVMADGIVAASEEHPDAIVDVATLTGAARVALGERYAGVMGDDELVARVRKAAESTGELIWPMPLPAELRPLLASDVADIANAKPGNTAAGMLLAGVFLQEFVGRTSEKDDAPRIPWAHLDIAGPANNSGTPFGYTPKGSSGVATRLLIGLAESFAR